jgi:DNA-binding GntR family transcriptional regulator
VAAELFQTIVSATLRPGERIYEENLAHRLGVAKAALREALQNLKPVY